MLGRVAVSMTTPRAAPNDLDPLAHVGNGDAAFELLERGCGRRLQMDAWACAGSKRADDSQSCRLGGGRGYSLLKSRHSKQFLKLKKQ